MPFSLMIWKERISRSFDSLSSKDTSPTISRQCSVCACAEDSCQPCTNPESCGQKNCNACCCQETHTLWRQKRIHQGVVVEYVSIAWMLAEVVGSLIAGVLASSFALIAFGSDSVIELASAFIVLRHLRLDDAGSNVQGERTALLTSLLLIGIVPIIGLTSTYSSFVLHVHPEASILGLAVAICAVVIMPVLWREKRKIGLETGCLPLSIDAIESAACFFMSLALLAGLALEFVFHTGWFDYAATLVILAFVAFEGRESFEEAMKWKRNNSTSGSRRDKSSDEV